MVGVRGKCGYVKGLRARKGLTGPTGLRCEVTRARARSIGVRGDCNGFMCYPAFRSRRSRQALILRISVVVSVRYRFRLFQCFGPYFPSFGPVQPSKKLTKSIFSIFSNKRHKTLSMTVRTIEERSSAQSKIQRCLSIRELIEWAFQREFASIDFDALNSVREPAPSIGIEAVLIERARLGCKIDGGGRSDPHPDADAVAEALAVLPEGCGGRRMALWIAELARSGLSPDWSPTLRPLCRPREWRQTKHGQFAKTEACGRAEYMSRGRRRQVEVRFCPVVYDNRPGEMAAARRAYMQWVLALRELRDTFRVYGGLTAHQVSMDLPPIEPWKEIA